jgi:hypothetical protein
MWLLISTLMLGMLWAAKELLGESNKATADAGSNSADMEMAALDSVKPPAKVKAKGVSKEVTLKKQIAQIDKDYKAKLETAKSEIASGKEVREATRSEGLKLAKDFKVANDQLASWYDGNGSTKNADVCRAVGESRIASADMAFNKIDSAKIDASNAKQEALNKTVKVYLADAKNELSPEDRAEIKASVGPKLQQLTGNLNQLVSTVTGLLKEVQSGANPTALAGAAAGCATTKAAGGDSSPADAASSLLMPLKSLLSLVQGMVSNISTMLNDVNTL